MTWRSLWLVGVLLAPAPAAAGVARVWAVNDGEKVEQNDLASALQAGNSAWDGRTARIFGARNEVLAFQVIVESDAAGIGALSVALPELRLRGSADRIAYAPPGADPSDSVGRPIQLFSVHYMDVTAPSRADWVWKPGSAAAPRDTVGWKPVQLVPENAAAGRGGFPLRVAPARGQSVWIEVYTGRGRPAGVYEGVVTVTADGATRTVPVELRLFDFTLPDANSVDAMVYYEPSQPELYHGQNLDAAYHRFAHRYRVELVHRYDEASVRASRGRFEGSDFTKAAGYEGPGEGVGNRVVPASFYGPGPGWDEKESAWRKADAWMDFLGRELPRARTFLYMPDEPARSEYPRILKLADNVHSNPGPGAKLPVFVTKHWVSELDGAIDVWCAGPQHVDLARVAQERAKGRGYCTYNGGRPNGPALVIDAPATEARAVGWAVFKHDLDLYFFWHGVHWRHNSQKQGEPKQNVWANPITFDNRGQPGKPILDQGPINGDGVLFYPGQERVHPEEDRGIAGPIASVQLANLRRGLQDHQYLTLAKALGLRAVVEETLQSVVPRVFSDAKGTVGFAESGDAYEAARLKLATALAASGRGLGDCKGVVLRATKENAMKAPFRTAVVAMVTAAGGVCLLHAARERPPLPKITAPILFDTPEADRVLAALQVFPPDNPWHQDISAAPVHRDSARIIATIGADKSLGYNLDMGFVIVPPDQKKVPVKILLYPAESDPGPFPVPDNAPIENWPMQRNEDEGALPKPGQTLADLQRHGTGDRHVILVDPVNGLLHEFWQARRTDAGWEASNAATFNLKTGALRPERWTSGDAAGLPIFPAVVRYDEVERGMVEHAMRVTVRRTRRAYVLPATHWASPHRDPTYPRMGERFRLRRDFDVSSFPPHAQAVLKGLKTYGMFVADNGRDWLMSIAPDRRLTGLETLSRIKGSDFEVVDTGARSVEGD